VFNGLNDKSIKYRLIFGYAISMSISILITFTIYLVINKNLTDSKLYKVDSASTILFYNYLDQKVEDTKIISNNIITSDTFQNRFKENENLDSYYKELRRIVAYYECVSSIYVINNENKIESFNDKAWYQFDKEKFIENINFEELNKLQGKILYKIEEDKYVGNNENSIAISRAIVSRDNLDIIGYLVIYMNRDYINKIYKDFVESTTLEFLISDSQGNSISLPENSVLNQIKNNNENLINNKNRYNKVKNNNRSFNVIAKKSSRLNGEILSMSIPLNHKSESVLMIIVIILVNFIFIIIYKNIINKTVLKPIYNITNSIENMRGKPDLNIKFEVNEKGDEINQIGIALNNMMDNVNNLIDEVKREHIVQRKLELDVLTNNVKPHFLFNTLNVARALITLKKYDSSKQLLNLTSKYYRAWLNKGNDIITIRDEVDILKKYIEIMVIRDTEKFEIKYNIDESLYNYEIPKLILQPLVENALKHGVRNEEITLEININIQRANDKVVIIEVIDNGRGMEENVIETLTKGIQLNRESGFGIKNILERLSLYYGESDYKNIINIESIIDEYTKIILTLDENNLRRVDGEIIEYEE